MPLVTLDYGMERLVEGERSIMGLRLYSLSAFVFQRYVKAESWFDAYFTDGHSDYFGVFFVDPLYSLLVPIFTGVELRYRVANAETYREGVTSPGTINLKSVWSSQVADELSTWFYIWLNIDLAASADVTTEDIDFLALPRLLPTLLL